MNEGVIFEIQRWSTDDGPGIRSTIFFQGCPLRCAWCCNPEAWCPATAGPLQGRLMTAAAILAEVERDRVFYRRSGGGVTFSGGEATAQPDLLLELAQRLHDTGVHLALETCGHFPWDRNQPALALMDLVYFDLKHMDSEAHARLTGQPNGLILENAARLAAAGIPMILRVPLIPGRNDDGSNLAATADFAMGLPGRPGIELMPYHTLGLDKFQQLGLPYALADLAPATAEAVARAGAVLAGRGAKLV
jgi:pyruvate formate lyase activating enzyme